MAQISGFDLMILTKTNITKQAYCYNELRYDVLFLQEITAASVNVQRVVDLVLWGQNQGWSIESTHFHRPNLVICKVVTGKRTLIIGA